MKKNLLASVLIVAALGELAAQAQTFTYTPGDLLAAFRQTGKPDLIVDLGSISNYQVPYQNSSFTLGTDLTSAFGSTSGIYWSVFTFDGNGTYAPVNSLFMSAPRGNTSIQSAPLVTGTSSAQNLVTGQLGAIADALSSTYGTIIANQVIQLPAALGAANGGDPASYTTALGSGLDFNGTFGQSFENLSSSSATVSDLYQLNPTLPHNSANGALLGNFTLSADGTTLSFTAVPEPATWAMLGTGLMSLIAFRRLAKRN